ncbi:DNA-binding transcriptional ArsR family regulator [Paenibacillus cellulosilyticus]|uniref:DNA-binding transcriptional ArsR family regulator n=1 Tax=Paenibacillus cellulosilyticus TaxID=375489 RepID=A0A2V2YWE9_9BACL|nr:winged helix-turn-helix domain-containing protein [Paenibacillus cellulosilyticus]PWW05602.1 DNA-binding transcriptional ArsR family regulator [Paenibacillus cellulosilyticus]QKS45366.1 winged helix-turn-helix transcriptional regulator [Paenibacillus cellulosilyticus]
MTDIDGIDTDNERLSGLVTITYVESMEFILSMDLIANLSLLRQHAEQLMIDMNTEVIRLIEQAGQTLTPYQSRELSFFFGKSTMHPEISLGFLLSVFQDQDQTDVGSWLSRLAVTPAQEIVGQMVLGVCFNKMDELLLGETWEGIQHDLVKLRTRIEAMDFNEERNQKQSLLECLAQPEETKERYMRLFEQYNTRFFQTIATRMKEDAYAAVERYRTMFEDNPAAFLRRFLLVDPTVIDKPTIIHISVSAHIGNAIYAGNTPSNWASMGINNDVYFGEAVDTEKLEKLFKALSDKKRLEFMLLLRERQRFGKELAEELGITPGAVTYHAGFLLAADLIELHKSDNRHYYRIQKDRVIAQLHDAVRVLTGRSGEER